VDRPPFETIFMNLAEKLSLRSTCSRLSVGAVITSADFRRVLAIGYNGNAARLPNECDSNTPGACGCLHAEENACISCNEPRTTPKVFFCTHLPCKMCAKRIINLGGVVRVVYGAVYRRRDGADVLITSGIVLEHFER
jgi:dCMP deaminase